MCLGIPGELVEISDDDLALAEVSGVRRTVNIGLLRDDGEGTELAVGDWIVIHVGFALAKIDEAEAQSALRTLRDLGPAYDQELEEFSRSDVG